MTHDLFQLAAVVVIAAGLGFVARILKQPLVLAYLLAGGIIGYFSFFNLGDKTVFQTFSDLGIMFLLFLVGLEINYTALRTVGKPALIVGVGQIVFTSFFGFLIARAFDFGNLTSLYIAVALTFSSTIIILKLLSEKKDLHSLYGRISIGFLLVQDLVAILLLIALAGLGNGEFSLFRTGLVFAEGIALFAAMVFLGRTVLPLIFDKIARAHELLFLISLAWVFLVVALVKWVGLSIEIGGFLAGLALANSAENFQISSKIKPLRDFFIVIFFVILGSSVVFAGVDAIGVPAIVFSLFVLIGNPLIVLILMAVLGYRKRTSFLTGLTVAQISEFSLILMAMGLKLGHVGNDAVALVTLVGVLTITISTYLITYADGIFVRLKSILSFLERKKLKEEEVLEDGPNEVILIGCHRVGQSIAFALDREKTLIIDFDPEVIRELKKHGFKTVLGDAADPEIMDHVSFGEAKLVISTSPDLEDNLALLSYLGELEKRPRVILRAEDERDARLLYDKGVDYVLLPHFTAGQYLGKTIAIDTKMSILSQLKEHDLILMKKIARSI